MRRFLAAVALVALFGCEQAESPLQPEPDIPPPVASLSILDASYGEAGNPAFHWLPPMVKHPGYSGIFDGTLEPTVEICWWNEDACEDPPVAEFSMTTGPGSQTVRMVPEDEHYIVNWHTRSFDLDDSKTYRIRVVVDGFEVGHADVDLAVDGKALKGVDTDEFIPLKLGRTLPIKFRLEEGLLPPDLTEGLVARYPLDGDGTDVSGNDLHGSVSGPVATADRSGTGGGALLFDGENDYVKIPHDPLLNSESVALSGWFRLDESRPSAQFLAAHHGTGGSTLDPYSVFVLPGEILRVHFEGDGPGGFVQIGLQVSSVAVGDWHHFAASYDRESGEGRLYLDGELVDQDAHIITLHTNEIGVMLGGDMWADGSPRGDYLRGALDEVRIYSRPLTQEDVQALCDVPTVCAF